MILGFLLSPAASTRTWYPRPFDVVGDTRYAALMNKVSGKASHELKFVYNVCAALQKLHTLDVAREEVDAVAERPTSKFDITSRVRLHQLVGLASARYKVISLSTSTTAASETLHSLVFSNTEEDVYRPARDFLNTAQNQAPVRVQGRRHGKRFADAARGEDSKPTKGGRLK